jgi:ATP-dependent DNA helicase RecG
MPATADQIDLWRASRRETQRLEFKEAKQQFDLRKAAEYCVALANEGGGRLVLGIADKPPRQVVGSQAFSDTVETTRRLFEVVGFRVEIESVSHPDGRVVVCTAPSRPRGTAYNLQGRYLMRAGDALVPMTEDQLRKIFSEGEPDWLEEPGLLDLDDQKVVDLLDTQAYFDLLKLPYPTDRAAIIDRLLEARLIDRDDHGFSIRRLGGLLLAKNLADFPDLSRKAPRVVVYNGASKLETKLDQVGSLGYAAGFQRLIRFIMVQLPQNEIIKDALREATKLVPEEVIRELVANALIHQDFSIGGASVMIELFSNRLEISNPGEPIVPVERFIDGYQSRNERLADLMRRFRICEEKGSGIDKVVQAAEFYQLPAPDLRAGQRRTVVTLFGHQPFEAMTREDRVRACYQHAALKWVMTERMTNQSLRERFRLAETKAAVASQVISATIDAGYIKLDEAVGTSRKFARYLPFWA